MRGRSSMKNPIELIYDYSKTVIALCIGVIAFSIAIVKELYSYSHYTIFPLAIFLLCLVAAVVFSLTIAGKYTKFLNEKDENIRKVISTQVRMYANYSYTCIAYGIGITVFSVGGFAFYDYCLEDKHPQMFIVIAKSGLNIRAEPVFSSKVISHVSYGEIIIEVSRNGDWSNVDIDGDGNKDGFCKNIYLREIKSSNNINGLN